MPPDTMYSDNPGADGSAPDESQNADTEDQSQDQEGETFLVSKSNLGGDDPQPGDVCKFEVVRVHEDEVEFKYVKEDNKNESDNPDMAKAHAQMDEMAKE